MVRWSVISCKSNSETKQPDLSFHSDFFKLPDAPKSTIRINVENTEAIVKAYRHLAKIPGVAGARVCNNGKKINSQWMVRNLDRGKFTMFWYSYDIDACLNVVSTSDFGVDCSNIMLSKLSPTETYRALVMCENDAKNCCRQLLQVWKHNIVVHSINLTALGQHGNIYNDCKFGNIDWSSDEKAIVYVAERNLPQSQPFYARKPPGKPPENPPPMGDQNIYKHDWGEQFVGKYLSSIVVCKLEEEMLCVLPGLPYTWCPGQVIFTQDCKGVLGVAWETDPDRQAIIFCSNRPSFVFHLTLDGYMRKISKDGMAVNCPRLSPQGDRLIWMQRPTWGPHHACLEIVMSSVYESDIRTVVTMIETEIMTLNCRSFHGVYCKKLPPRCFSMDGRRIIFSTPQRTEVRAYVAYSDETNRIVELIAPVQPGSIDVLDVHLDIVIAKSSSVTTPGQIYAAHLPPEGCEHQIVWRQISFPAETPPDEVACGKVDYLFLANVEHPDPVQTFSAIYFQPKIDNPVNKLPMVVWPHGGPHINFMNEYTLYSALFAACGFSALQVNYRGSTGHGQATVDFIQGKVGDKDVSDCKLATDVAISMFDIAPNNIFLFGGSHGGFLVTHLSGQYPGTYKAVVSRNPVTDMATMSDSTDIRDWCAVESGFPYNLKGPLSEKELLIMRQMSPIAHIHKVKAPTALLLGKHDKRVPNTQGLEYSRRLRANGCITKVFMYDDNHSLSSLPSEMDNLLNSVKWFLTYLD